VPRGPHPASLKSTTGCRLRRSGSREPVFYDALIVIGARRRGPVVVADCWLAAENLMLAVCALGPGTCCIGSAVPAL
jgi:nitroreductase